MKIKKGQMITFTEGEYSDYCFNGLVVALKTFSLDKNKSEWENENTSVHECQWSVTYKSIERRITGTAFLPWLVRKGIVEYIDYIEIHTGSYGRSNIFVD